MRTFVSVITHIFAPVIMKCRNTGFPASLLIKKSEYFQWSYYRLWTASQVNHKKINSLSVVMLYAGMRRIDLRPKERISFMFTWVELSRFVVMTCKNAYSIMFVFVNTCTKVSNFFDIRPIVSWFFYEVEIFMRWAPISSLSNVGVRVGNIVDHGVDLWGEVRSEFMVEEGAPDGESPRSSFGYFIEPPVWIDATR